MATRHCKSRFTGDKNMKDDKEKDKPKPEHPNGPVQPSGDINSPGFDPPPDPPDDDDSGDLNSPGKNP